MLSEKRKMTRADYLKALPPIEKPINVRLKFVKKGNLQYISHLDLQRSFNRILVRSGLPVWYSKGFNPHIKLVFSTPLSVGTQSECEYLDLKLDRELPFEDVKAMLNAEMTDEMYIKEVYTPKMSFSEIAYCEYELEISCEGASSEMARNVERALSESPLNVIKKTKSGEKEIDIIPLIKSCGVSYSEERGTVMISTVLNATTENFLKPELVMTALKDKLGIMSGDMSREWYSIMRKRLLTEALEEFV